MSKIKSLAASLLVTATFLPAMALAGDVVTVTDITGREVEVEVPVEKVILGEGRQIYFTAALDGEDPFKRVVGWRDDFEKADNDGYHQYLEKYPEMADLPTFGGMKNGTFDVEQAVVIGQIDLLARDIGGRAVYIGFALHRDLRCGRDEIAALGRRVDQCIGFDRDPLRRTGRADKL